MNSVQQNHDNLLALKMAIGKTPIINRLPMYRPVLEKALYETTKNRMTTTVYVDRVKKDQVILKRTEDAVDSFTVSTARFDSFYRLLKLPNQFEPTASNLQALDGIQKFSGLLAKLKASEGQLVNE